MKRSKMTQIDYNYRNEDWIVTIETNTHGYYTISVDGGSYPVIEQMTTDTLKDKNILIEQLIDTILDKYFWNIDK